ncbi:hypothetical protein CHS0354_025270 [Potamilus streckersoni]|uniref:Uncharacterized protein n=1 Tax=Potamilus streckersoni TaxID=2493646 RepID=A0AAE0RS49_9BIVA|nr:hypothetical protein CHS0354_025270 [Potamilus streckersoni]
MSSELMQKCQTTLKLPVIQLRTNSDLKDDDKYRNIKVNNMPRVAKKCCPKLGNSFARSKRQNVRKLWKVPAKFHSQQKYSNNVVAYTGLHDRQFHVFYGRLLKENTVLLPPKFQRLPDMVHDGLSIQEKDYVNKYVSCTGKLERFFRDEVHVPDVYARFLACADCRLQYATNIYTQTFARGNDLSPAMCQKVKPSSSVQYCDVLGERFCTECIRQRNRNFSLKIENSGVLKGVAGPRRRDECVHFNL